MDRLRFRLLFRARGVATRPSQTRQPLLRMAALSPLSTTGGIALLLKTKEVPSGMQSFRGGRAMNGSTMVGAKVERRIQLIMMDPKPGRRKFSILFIGIGKLL